MSSDLSLIPDQVVAYLRAFPDLAPLTRTDDTGTYYAIVGMNREDLLSQITAAMNSLAVSVTVLVERVMPDDRNMGKDVVYDPVHFLIEIAERVEMNKITPANNPPGLGTGMEAWEIADRIYAALKWWPVAGLARPYRVEAREPGIVNVTKQEDAAAGVKILRLHFATKAEGVARA